MKILELLTKNRVMGNRGETAAASYLRKNKYKILERNYVAHKSEIDIIASNKEYLVFVEVKSRTEGRSERYEPRPASSVTPEKQRKILSAARYYLAYNQQHKKVRFDIIEIYYTAEGKVSNIDHIISAFGFNSAYNR